MYCCCLVVAIGDVYGDGAMSTLFLVFWVVASSLICLEVMGAQSIKATSRLQVDPSTPAHDHYTFTFNAGQPCLGESHLCKNGTTSDSKK